MSCLSEDRQLLTSFLRDIAEWRPPSTIDLEVLEQRLPGEETEESVDERKGLPDGWIHDGDSWSLLIESKIGLALTSDQLRRHLSTARRRGFEDVHLLAIVVSPPDEPLPADVSLVEWRQVYRWLQHHVATSRWAELASEYMNIVERKMTDEGSFTEGSLTEFTGFRFGPKHPYSYGEGKRLLRLAMEELRKDQRLQTEIGMDPNLPGRHAITGTHGDLVWDFLQLRDARGAKKFTRFPHLNLVIRRDFVAANLVLPNAMQPTLKKRLTDLKPRQFTNLLCAIEKNSRPLAKRFNAIPAAVCLHRHFRGQKVGILDARLEFDLRTLSSTGESGPVKACDAWGEAARAGLMQRGINYELSIGARVFHEDEGPLWDAETALEFAREAWLTCVPMREVLFG